MTADEIFRIQNMIRFLEGQQFVQKKRDYSELFTSVLGVLCSRYIPQYDSFVPQGQTGRQEAWIDSNYGSLKKAVRMLRRSLFGSRIDYRPLLVRELQVLGGLCKQNTNLFEPHLLKLFGWKEAMAQKLVAKVTETPEYRAFADFIAGEDWYFYLPKFNIAVVATMSAGKSTFINALLGHDYLPSRNEATTTTITTVQDKDGLQVLFGCVEMDGGLVPCKHLVTLEQMNQWNDDPKVRHIHLQGDLDNIGNHHAVVCVHDTPGTNNSGDTSHEAITMEFLRNNEMDAVIFVANGEHLCTTDEKRLLEDLQKTLGGEVPVIFALNKMDSHDSQKEDLAATIQQYRAFVKELGFDDSMVYPVSAKAARLFKMALKGRSGDFTAKERMVFGASLHLLVEDTHTDDTESGVEVGSLSYSATAIADAMARSGLPAIEREINRLVETNSV